MSLKGELGFSTVDAALRQWSLAPASETVDLSQVTRIDSAGASFLLEIQRRAAAGGHKLKFTGANAQVRSLLDFFELTTMLAVE